MNAPSEDIKDLIVSITAYVFKEDIVFGREPADPGNVISILDTPDLGPVLEYEKEDDDDVYEYVGIQVRVRHKKYSTAMSRSIDLKNKLHGRGQVVINGTRYTVIEALDNPALLDFDENNRARVITNYALQRTPQPS